MIKPNKQDIQIWIDALRLGKYKQTKGMLQGREGYCCLGVACDLFIKEDVLRTEQDFIYGFVPRDQPGSPVWLVNNLSINLGHSFAVINDLMDFSFDEIADLIEAVYILEVLE